MTSPVASLRLPAPARAWWALGLLVALLFAAIGWGVHAIYQAREQRYRHQIEGGLQAVNHMQVRGVTDWRRRRLREAAALTDDRLLAQAVARWRATAAPDAEQAVRERLRILVEHVRYTAAYFVDPQGRLILDAGGPATGTLQPPEMRALEGALARAEPGIVELRRDPAFAFPFFGLLAPLYDGTASLGAIWLVMDARTTLYPLLETWPTSSRTAESVLVERQDDTALFLSPLRHRSDEPLALRLPAEPGSRDPMVLAVAGVRGAFYGSDYRNQPVLAVASAVPDSPWLLVSKVDVADAFTAAQRREWLALSLFVSLGLLSLGCVVVLWQGRAWRRERALKAELERNLRWLDNAQKAASVGYFVYEGQSEAFIMSRMASAIFGLPSDGRMTLRQWVGMVHPDERAQTLEIHGRAMSERIPLRTQYRIQRNGDGQVRWIEVWGEYGDSAGDGEPLLMTGTVQDITDRKHTEDELARYRNALESQVRMDPLTQVANRLALDEAVARAWSQALREGSSLSLLMIDVDHFKAYNDYYGHVAGDLCLQRVASALASALGRPGDLLARYGGEEFAVLLPGADADAALAVAHRLQEVLRALSLEHRANPGGFTVTASMGLAHLRPADVVSAGTETRAGVDAAQPLFQQADAALYRAKQLGRDRVVSYDAQCAATLYEAGQPAPAIMLTYDI